MAHFDTTPFDWFNFVARECNSNALIQFVLKTDNNLSINTLQQALNCCIIREPILGCIFDKNETIPQWKEQPFDIQQLCRSIESDDSEKEIKLALGEKIDAERDCPLKLIMVKSGNNTFLVIKTHHALCDAGGALEFVRLLAEMYCEVEKNPDFRPQEVASRRGTESFYRHFAVTDKASRFNPSLLGDMTATWGTTIGDLSAEQQFDYRTIRFSEEEVDNIFRFAKAHGSSINAVVTAVYHRVLCSLLKVSDKTKEIQFSANLRKYTDQTIPNTICNLSNLFNIQLPTHCDFAQLVREAKKSIDKVTDPEIILQTVLGCELMSTDYNSLADCYKADWESIKTTGLCTPMIANIGRLDNAPIGQPDSDTNATTNRQDSDTSRFGSSRIEDMYVVSPAFVSPSFMLSVSTFHNKMTLCAAYMKPSLKESFVTSLLEQMYRLLTTRG
ncbi:MAG: condensation domain-containing protein [Bacteroidales bacterium]|nr:condensation domain-containing protein [Bacteroidales bacterium]